MATYFFETNNIHNEISKIKSEYRSEKSKHEAKVDESIIKMFKIFHKQNNFYLPSKEYKLVNTSSHEYANLGLPDKVIFSNACMFSYLKELENISKKIGDFNEAIEILDEKEIRSYIAVGETDVTFIQDWEKGGNTLRRLKSNNGESNDYDYEINPINLLINDQKHPFYYKVIFNNIEDKHDYWDDLQQSLLTAINKKNNKNYKTSEVYLSINIAHKLSPLLIEESGEQRGLFGKDEVFAFCFKCIDELEKLAKKNHKTFSNLSCVLIYFTIVTKDSPYGIMLPCFLKGDFINAKYLLQERVYYEQKNQIFNYILPSSLLLLDIRYKYQKNKFLF